MRLRKDRFQKVKIGLLPYFKKLKYGNKPDSGNKKMAIPRAGETLKCRILSCLVLIPEKERKTI